MEKKDVVSKEPSAQFINIDGEPDNFEGGATRYTKNGKGRFDLIPANVITHVLDVARLRFADQNNMTISKGDILTTAMLANGENAAMETYLVDTIIGITIYVYTNRCKEWLNTEYTQTSCGNEFVESFSKMLLDLAKHYEIGAEKYGVDNWKKGIPISGGNRGGSFIDSMQRHVNQFVSATEGHLIADDDFETYTREKDNLQDQPDLVFDERNHKFFKLNYETLNYDDEEPHHIAAIWNACCALWYLKNKPTDDELSLCEGPIPPRIVTSASKGSGQIQAILSNIGIFNSVYRHHLSKLHSFDARPTDYSHKNSLWYKLYCINVQISALLVNTDFSAVSVLLMNWLLEYSSAIVYIAFGMYPSCSNDSNKMEQLPEVSPEFLTFEPKTFVESIKAALWCTDDWYAFSLSSHSYTKAAIDSLKEIKELYKYNVEEFSE